MSDMGVPSLLIQLINGLCDNHVAGCIHFMYLKVRQRCIFLLFPHLFNAYRNYIMRNALYANGKEGEASIAGRKVSNLLFADDTALFSNREE